MASRHLDCAPALSNLPCEQQAYCPTLLRPPIRVRPSRAAISAAAAAERTTRRSTSRARLVANSPVPRPLLMTSVRESCRFDQSSRGTPILVLSVYRGVPRTLWALMWCRVAGCRSSARTLLLKRVVPLGVACCIECAVFRFIREERPLCPLWPPAGAGALRGSGACATLGATGAVRRARHTTARRRGVGVGLLG